MADAGMTHHLENGEDVPCVPGWCQGDGLWEAEDPGAPDCSRAQRTARWHPPVRDVRIPPSPSEL